MVDKVAHNVVVGEVHWRYHIGQSSFVEGIYRHYGNAILGIEEVEEDEDEVDDFEEEEEKPKKKKKGLFSFLSSDEDEDEEEDEE